MYVLCSNKVVCVLSKIVIYAEGRKKPIFYAVCTEKKKIVFSVDLWTYYYGL